MNPSDKMLHRINGNTFNETANLLQSNGAYLI